MNKPARKKSARAPRVKDLDAITARRKERDRITSQNARQKARARKVEVESEIEHLRSQNQELRNVFELRKQLLLDSIVNNRSFDDVEKKALLSRCLAVEQRLQTQPSMDASIDVNLAVRVSSDDDSEYADDDDVVGGDDEGIALLFPNIQHEDIPGVFTASVRLPDSSSSGVVLPTKSNACLCKRCSLPR